MTAVFTPLSKGFSWVDPTSNVDGSPIVPGELIGYELGVRADGDAAHGPANYSSSVSITGAGASTEAAAAFVAALKLSPGNYWAAVRAVGPVDSAWSAEVAFNIPAPPPVPNPPSGFSVA